MSEGRELVEALSGLSTSESVVHARVIAPLQPSFTFQSQQHFIRVLASDAYCYESDEDDVVPDDDRVEEDALLNRLEQNKRTLELKSSNWQIEDHIVNGQCLKIVRKPTISKIYHELMHPALYRNLKGLEYLDQLAKLLEVPDDWEQRFNSVYVNDIRAKQALEASIASLHSATTEAELSARWICLVQTVATCYGFHVEATDQTKVIIGGLLAKPELFVRGNTDASFTNRNGESVLNSELKTAESFPMDAMWYDGSRGPQTLLPLFSNHSPTFEVTRQHWKLFVENNARDQVFTFPMHTEETTPQYLQMTAMQPMGGLSLLKGLYITLLAKCDAIVEPAIMMTTPKKVMVDPKYQNSEDRSTTLRRRISSNPGRTGKAGTSEAAPGAVDRQTKCAPAPKYIGGYDENGKPIYVTIEILSADVVEELGDAMRGDSDSMVAPGHCSSGYGDPLACQKVLQSVCRSVLGVLDSNRDLGSGAL